MKPLHSRYKIQPHSFLLNPFLQIPPTAKPPRRSERCQALRQPNPALDTPGRCPDSGSSRPASGTSPYPPCCRARCPPRLTSGTRSTGRRGRAWGRRRRRWAGAGTPPPWPPRAPVRAPPAPAAPDAARP